MMLLLSPRFWPRVLITCLSLIGVLLLPFPSALARQTTIKDTVYVSPTWGFSVRWHYDDWMLDLDLSVVVSVILGLRDTGGYSLLFTGERGFAGNADACLDQMIVDAGETPAPDLAVAVDSAGARYESRGPEQA